MKNNKFITNTNIDEVFAGKLWRVTSSSGAINYMLGTAHFSDAYVSTLSPEVQQIIELCNEVLFENVGDSAERFSERASLLLGNQAKTLPEFKVADIEAEFPELYVFLQKMLRDYLRQEKFNKKLLENITEISLPGSSGAVEEIFLPRNFGQLSLYPLLFLTLIYICHPPTLWNEDLSNILDAKLEDIAKKGKITTGLESETSRFMAFLTLNQNEQLGFLFDAVERDNYTKHSGFNLTEKIVNNLYKNKFKYDYATNRMISSSTLNQSIDPENSFEKFALIARNQQMLHKLETKLEEGNKLVCVGLRHYAYSHGLLAGLKDRGYKIERIYETPNVIQMSNKAWFLSGLSCLAMLHPRYRKIIRPIAYTSTISTLGVSIDTIYCNKPPEKSLLWAASRAFSSSVRQLKQDINDRSFARLSVR